jgi:serine/threonine protein kinase
MQGTPFGRYRLVELLGRGGMGEVWRAHDTVIDRTVAIKMLLPHFALDKTFEQRFRREARSAARLDEPHVVPIYDVGEIDGRLYVAMRLINGQDLQTLLDRGPLEPDRAVGIIKQIASALQAAHKVALVHRDIKPSNILVTEDDFAYLIDFGIARAAGETGITSTGATIGTWSYMAPERFSSGEIEPGSDIYALTCVLYQSLTGQLPFPGTTMEQVAMAHMTAPPPKASAQRHGIPMAMDDVIATGLAKDPRQRYSTPKDLAQAARRVLNQDQADTIMADTQAAPTSPAPASSPAPKVDAAPPRNGPGNQKPRKTWLIATIAAVVAVILIAGLIALWRPWERNTVPSARESRGPATTPAPPQLTATTAVQPPPPPSFSPKNIDQVLLTAGQLTKLLGANVTNDPSAGGPGAPGLNSSSYGMADHSGQVTPRSCVGVIFTGEHDVYATADPTAIKTQMFGTPAGINPGSPHLIQQTVAVFPSADGAQQLLTSSTSTWKACGSQKVDATFGYESGAGYIFSDVAEQADMITLAMASTNNLGPTNGADACQQALAARQNVVVEVRTCEAPNLTSAPNSPNPAWAVPDAERVAKAMLANVKP